MRRYRFSLDDNIHVFQDLAQNQYDSIFENDYLSLLRSIHMEFNTKIQLNIYYETTGFRLSDMPDRYKQEWEAASDWLRLSFHARSDDTRYRDCDYETMYNDCSQVHSEILRFAGEKSLSYFTTLHYVACPKVGVEALRDCGIKGLVGLYGTEEKPRIPYHLSSDISKYMRMNCFYHDDETGMEFMRNDIVLNEHKADVILPYLEKRIGNPFIEVMIHEQYFYKDFRWYLPDFAHRLYITMNYLTNAGYIPAFFEDIYTL